MAYERIVKRFYDELKNGKILGRKCTRCGAVEFPPVLACNSCSCPDMEWIEMSGRGQVTLLVKPSMMTTVPENEPLRPYCYGSVTLDEGAEMNAIIRGIEDVDEARTHLPLAVKMSIIQRDGYKSIVFDVCE